MPNAPSPDAVVLRFSPMSANGILHRATLDARRSDGKGHFTASVWSDHAHADETIDDVITRLLRATELHGLIAHRNPHYWWCTTAHTLLDRGFEFEKDEYDGEPDEHYSVILGDPPTLEDTERFVTAFIKERRPG